MRKFFIIAMAVTFFVSLANNAAARPLKGFHTGPYLMLELGAMQVTSDHNEVTNTDIGRTFEPSFGFIFGWNIYDFFSAELQGRYSTNFNGGAREHIAGGNLYGKYTLILDSLTDFKSLRILPFAKAGLSTRIMAMPNTANGSTNTVTNFGIGPSFGGGVAFMLFKYFYFGVDVQEDLLVFNGVNKTVNGVPNTPVYKGGFHPSFAAMGMIGVHY